MFYCYKDQMATKGTIGTASSFLEEDEEISSSWTAILIAVVSLVLYCLFLRPTTKTQNSNNMATPPMRARQGGSRRQFQRREQNQPPREQLQQQQRRQQQPIRQTNSYLSEAAEEILVNCQTKPSHVITSSDKVGLGGRKVLVDGLVAFSHTKAGDIFTSTNSGSTIRTERAKVLSRIASAPGVTMKTPPSKGSTVVVSLSSSRLDDTANVSSFLYTLGSYYNLIVIIHVHNIDGNNFKEQQQKRRQLQDRLLSPNNKQNDTMRLTEDILPKHRILISSADTGRVALVRQLSKVELVIDFDSNVQSELGRFGYMVAVIPDFGTFFKE